MPLYRNIVYFVWFLTFTTAISFAAVLFNFTNQGTSQKVIKVTVNTTTAAQQVSDKFLSVSLDNRLLQKRWAYFNFSSPRIFTLAGGLTPGYLRIGGTPEDWLIYQNNKRQTSSLTSDHFQRGNFTEYNITSDDLDKIHLIASKAGWKVLFGLNVCLRTQDDKWNFTNPVQIMQYVAEKGYQFGWELGNEPDNLGRFGKAIPASILGEDFVTLRNILKQNPKYGNFLVGPDLTKPKNKSMEFLKKFLDVARDVIDKVTWHQYYFSSRTCKTQDFYDPEILDYLLHQLQLLNHVMSQSAPNKRHWLGETATAWGGGAQGLSNRFAATFTWMDKLGLAARLGAEVVVKQTFFHGNYALVDDSLHPSPNYWLSLLHKRLVGQTVLDVQDGLRENRVVRVYAHCTRSSRQYREGAVSIMAMNLSPSQNAVLSLSGFLASLPVDQYMLTSPNGDMTSQYVLLNGRPLLMSDDDTLPTLNPVTLETGNNLDIPPLALGFFVIPKAQARVCLKNYTKI